MTDHHAFEAAQVLAVVLDPGTRDAINAAAQQLGLANARVREGGGDASVGHLKASSPTLLIADVSDATDPLMIVQTLVTIAGADTRIIIVGLVNDVKFYRQLLEMGVSDYVVKPATADVFVQSIETALKTVPPMPTTGASAQMIAMIGTRGGVGTTSVALSVAWTLSNQKKRVVMLDLDLHFGSLSLSLDLEPTRGLRELLSSPDRIDSLLISAATTNVRDGLRLIGAEEPLEDLMDLDHEGLSELLSGIEHTADFVVVDLPRSIGRMTRHIISEAEVIVIVTDQSLAAMRDTARLISLIKEMRRNAKVLVVANRVGGVPGEISRADFERGCGAKLDFVIPYDAKAAMSAAEGAKPLVEAAKATKVATELQALASALSGVQAPKSGKPGKAAAGSAPFLNRILGR